MAAFSSSVMSMRREPLEHLLGDVALDDSVLVAALGVLLDAGQGLLDRLVVGEHELGVDGVDVALGVDAAIDVDDVGVGEVAHDLADGVGLADVCEELVAEALADARALDEARDVDELDRCGNDAAGMHHVGKHLEALVGNLDDADVGIDGCEGIVRSKHALLGEDVEQGRLTDVGKANDAN